MTEIIWIDQEELKPQLGPLKNWSGGPCPVPANTRVKVYFRAREPYVGPALRDDFSAAARENMWQHAPAGGGRVDPRYDIIAYQEFL